MSVNDENFSFLRGFLGFILGCAFICLYHFSLIPDYSFTRLCIIMAVAGLVARIIGRTSLLAYAITVSIISFIYPMDSYKEKLILLVVNILLSALLPQLHNNDTAGIRSEDCFPIVLCIYVISSIYCAVKVTEHKLYYILAAIILSLIASRFANIREGVEAYDKELEEKQEEHRQNVSRVNNSDYAKATNKSYSDIINDKGNYGEYVVSTWLTDIETYYKSLYSVYVPFGSKVNGNYTKANELDSVVITRAGIYCIEVKNQKTKWIIRNETDDAICTYPNGEGKKAHNPFKQNDGHVNALKEYLASRIKGESNIPVRGIVIFGPETLDVTANVNRNYCFYRNAGTFINELVSDSKPCLSDKQIDLLYDKILLPLQDNPKYKALHQYNIAEKKLESGTKISF